MYMDFITYHLAMSFACNCDEQLVTMKEYINISDLWFRFPNTFHNWYFQFIKAYLMFKKVLAWPLALCQILFIWPGSFISLLISLKWMNKKLLFNIKLHLDSVSFAFFWEMILSFCKFYSIINIFILPVITYGHIFTNVIFLFNVMMGLILRSTQPLDNQMNQIFTVWSFFFLYLLSLKVK